jgi:5-methylcytosine-specific restriction protein A
MRIELVIFFVAAGVVFHIYTEGKYTKWLLQQKKYWQIGGIVVGALILCWLLRKDPSRAKSMIETTHEYLKYMPIDGGTSRLLSPILDMTAKHAFLQESVSRPVLALDAAAVSQSPTGGSMDGGGGGRVVKRSVSETKKKYVAARQRWTCKDCGVLLTATYEIDHIVRLDRGGTNHVDNLAALCPNCHRQKTMLENL